MFGLNDDKPGTIPMNGVDTTPPALPADKPVEETSSTSAPSLDSAPAAQSPTPAAPADEDLMGIKQQALQSLMPLVGHLNQTPEEKFKTTMMMIQATDNASLISDAYGAANQITDEKTRAQALLDVVNEINYFTQKNNAGADKS